MRRGNCYGVALAIVEDFGLDAVARYGHYTGKVHGLSYFNAGRPFQRHGWVELWDGRILDPTRWVFEQPDGGKFPKAMKPYIYVGPNDCYDLGGEQFLAEHRRSAPPQERWPQEKSAPTRVPVRKPSLKHWIERWFPGAYWGSSDENGKLVEHVFLWISQLHWATHLPSEFLHEHEIIRPLFESTIEAGEAAMIPIDIRRDVFGDDDPEDKEDAVETSQTPEGSDRAREAVAAD